MSSIHDGSLFEKPPIVAMLKMSASQALHGCLLSMSSFFAIQDGFCHRNSSPCRAFAAAVAPRLL
eukprot:2663439-Amphidinium_carterae.1